MHLDHICGCYCHFIYLLELKIIPTNNPVVATASTTGIFCLYQFHSSKSQLQSYIFGKKCWKNINKEKLLKYNISNRLSQLCCQNYPLALENLSISKKTVIAETHPVVTILKLGPNNRFNLGSYRKIWDHAIILP